MPASSQSHAGFEFYPLTCERWEDFVELFSPRGAPHDCWCMWWRMKTAEFNRHKGEGNRKAMKKLVDSGKVPGILAYSAGRAVGWCSVGPRTDFGRLVRSPVLKPIDDQPVWSVVCLFVARDFRRRGLSVELLKAAVRYAGRQGAKIVEGYPLIPRKEKVPDWLLYVGLPSTFERAGFRQMHRPSQTRAIMRYYI